MADDSEGNQRVATVDEMTNEQFAKLILHAQKAFGSRSQKTFGKDAELCKRAGVGATLVAIHRHNRQPEEDE